MASCALRVLKPTPSYLNDPPRCAIRPVDADALALAWAERPPAADTGAIIETLKTKANIAILTICQNPFISIHTIHTCLPRRARPRQTSPSQAVPCRAMPSLPFRAMPCRAMPSRAKPALPCQALPGLALPSLASPSLPFRALPCRSEPCPALPAK
jgi:hypothetical protein